MNPSRIFRPIIPGWVRRLRSQRRFRRDHPTLRIDPKADVTSCEFGNYVSIDHHAWLTQTKIGDHSYVADYGYVAFADIGRFCSIGNRCFVGLFQHPTSRFVSTHPAFYARNPKIWAEYVDRDYFPGALRTVIGNDVWVGAAAQIKSGLRVGDGAIVAAGAVVTKDVEPYAIVAGVPAKLIRYRFDPGVVDFLLRFRWWDRSEEWLRHHVHEMQDVSALRGKFDTDPAVDGPETAEFRIAGGKGNDPTA